jgi:hypothetical protein
MEPSVWIELHRHTLDEIAERHGSEALRVDMLPLLWQAPRCGTGRAQVTEPTVPDLGGLATATSTLVDSDDWCRVPVCHDGQ